MASQQGVCTNFGNCSKADNKEKISIPMGSDFICPECDKALSPNGKTNGNDLLPKIILIVVCALAAGGTLIYFMTDRPAKSVPSYASSPSDDGKKTSDHPSTGKSEASGNEKKIPDSSSGNKPFSVNTQSSKNVADTSPPDAGNLGDKPQSHLEAQVNLQQGMSYAKLKDFDNAIKEFTLAIEKYPNYAVAYSNRAVAYMQQNKYNKALEDLNRAIQIEPNNPDIYYNLMALHSLEKKIDLALDALDKCLEYGFNNYDALRKDSDLANLRKHPEFKKTLEKHKVFIY